MGLNVSVKVDDKQVLFCDRLGDVGFIERIRKRIAQHPGVFPLILSKVIYSTAHCGDELTPQQASEILSESEVLREYLFEAINERDKESIDQFAEVLTKACQCAIANKSNIVF